MEPVLSFVIPVRHPDNGKDHALARRNLAATLASVASQTDPRWNGVVIANPGTDLPPMPEGFLVRYVDFPPNKLDRWDAKNQAAVVEALRSDKGNRVLAGLMELKPTQHVMVLDDDDFVSKRLVAFVAEHQNANGWFFEDGWLWSEGDWYVCAQSEFFKYCGSSHIVKAELYRLPLSAAAADQRYVRKILGSHLYTRSALEEAGTPLAPLPFAGAIYRVGHAVSFMGGKRTFKRILPREIRRRQPREAVRRLLRFRLLTKSLRREFFGHA